MKIYLNILLFFISLTTLAQPYSEIDKVIASDRAEFDRFGSAVATNDNYAFVGAFGSGNYNNGQVYVFERLGNSWVQTQILQNSDNENYDRFGWSIAVDGDWLIIGAPREDDDENGNNNISKAGSVYIFKNINGTWTQTQKIVASDRSTDDEFGWSVDVDGNTLIVGAHQDFENVVGLDSIHHAGSCYLFDLDVNTNIWAQTQKIVASDRAPDLYYPNGYNGEDLSDQFGHTVGISGDYVIVGAINHDYRPDGSSGWQCGSAYIFERTSGIWTEVQHIINSDNVVSGGWERFGSDVAIDSNIIVIGMWAQDFTPTGTDYMKNAGAAYIFVRDATGQWNENQKIVAGMRNTGDHFGWDVKINDGIIIAGAEQDDHDENETNPLEEAGSAYIFQINNSGMFQQIQKIRGSDRDSLDEFGYAVDVYGNNAIVGAFKHDWNLIGSDSLQSAGKSYIFSTTICSNVTLNQTVNICPSDSYTVGNSVYSNVGNYIDTLQTTQGCDSILHTIIAFYPTYNETNDVTICQGGSYSIGNSIYTSPGNYTDSLLTINGCDSIINTNLTVLQTLFSQTVSLCAGQTISVGNSTYSTPGTYIDTLQSSNGCDSILTTTILLNNGFEITQNKTICYGETYAIGNSVYSVPGNYTDTLQMISGCDSIVHTNLTINPPLDLSLSVNGNEIESNQDNAAYLWVDCNNNYSPVLVNTANQQTITIEQTGNYAVILNVNNCIDTSACVYVEFVNLNQIHPSNYNLIIYPNPTQNILNIKTTSEYQFEIIDLTGKIIYKNKGNQTTAVNVNHLSKGVYFIKITTKSYTVTKQFIKT